MSVLSEFLHPTPVGDLEGQVFEAVSSLPFDPAPTWEGSDAVHAVAVSGRQMPRLADASAQATAGPRVVPFVRTVRAGMSGLDVTAFQRALIAAGFRKLRPSGVHGPVSVRNVRAFKQAHDIRSTSNSPFDGVYDLATHHHLARFFDAYGAYLLMQARKQEKLHEIRQRIVAAVLFGVSVRTQIHYSQGSQRLDAVARHLVPPRFPAYTDCSGYSVWAYQVGGGPDPCGHDFNVRAVEFTGTMAQSGREVRSPQIADLCLYGKPPNFDHVTIFIGNGMCVSNGSEPGPLVLPVHYRSDLAQFRTYL